MPGPSWKQSGPPKMRRFRCRCRNMTLILIGPDGRELPAELDPDPAGRLVLVRQTAYPLDDQGLVDGKRPQKGAVRYAAHRCPMETPAAAAFKAEAHSRSTTAINAATHAPCAVCQAQTRAYGRNASPRCVACSIASGHFGCLPAVKVLEEGYSLDEDHPSVVCCKRRPGDPPPAPTAVVESEATVPPKRHLTVVK